jgi:hypothetical protein
MNTDLLIILALTVIAFAGFGTLIKLIRHKL